MGYYDLGSLTPGQEYWYQLESCNRINCSSSPSILKAKIRALPTSFSSSNDTSVSLVIGSSVAVCIVILAVVITVYFLKKKSVQQNGKSGERKNGSPEPDNTQPDVLYAAVDKSLQMKNKQQTEVMKSDVKDKNEKKLQGKKEEAEASIMNSDSRTVNQDGLVYIEVEFTNKNFDSDIKGRPVIHGEEKRTEYVFVDFSKKAPPIQKTQDDAK
ncbi:uncharacterized protein LOC133179721 [Saccostrea echinata]|uniref:uncharacterized protein LOC133179721 n=1 Tax=Saccostrea echinata TaxID=191078 RepID=UPI002A7F6801|nr:uncharacterized protein LOC133179721 [Saccostrea echinata]